jgi:hypothetical protein
MTPCRALAGLLCALALSAPLSAQVPDSVPAAPRAPAADSSVVRPPPVGPMGALWRSFLLPGWGQAKLGRKLTGGIFVAWEGVTLGMTLKTSHELGYLERTGSGRVAAKRSEREDWLILLAFNHLMSGLEAYVSAHLWDFPRDLAIRAVPGGIGGRISLPHLR